MPYYSRKVFPPLSCAFRQAGAVHSHCRFVHGYGIVAEIVFAANTLDARNWVVDFGGLKPIKAWLEDNFDHKLIVAHDDPHLDKFRELEALGLVEVRVFLATGCEAFAQTIGLKIREWLRVEQVPHGATTINPAAWLHSVTVHEHAFNSATVEYDCLGNIVSA